MLPVLSHKHKFEEIHKKSQENYIKAHHQISQKSVMKRKTLKASCQFIALKACIE
jgi:hypothetical protein